MPPPPPSEVDLCPPPLLLCRRIAELLSQLPSEVDVEGLLARVLFPKAATAGGGSTLSHGEAGLGGGGEGLLARVLFSGRGSSRWGGGLHPEPCWGWGVRKVL